MDFLDGVHAQPGYLARSREEVTTALADIDLGRLPGSSTAVVGIGASGHAAVAFAAELRRRGAPAAAVSAGEARGITADTYVAVSFSGRSRETVEALDALPPGRRIGVTGNPDAPLRGVVDRLVPLGRVTDTTVSTLSYTATLQALALLAARAYGDPPGTADRLPDQVATVLTAAAGDQIADVFSGANGIDVIGAAHRFGSAGAAALLLREAVHLPTAAYRTHEYLHGPLEAAGPGRGALVFGSGREVELAAQLADWGAPTVLVTDDPAAAPTGVLAVHLPDAGPLGGCVLDVLPVQLAAAELARRRGIPIALRHMPADTKLAGDPQR